MPARSHDGLFDGSSFSRPGRTGRGHLLALLLLLLVNVVVASPSLDNGFSLDDYNWLERAKHKESTRAFLLAPEPGQVLNPIGRAFFLALHGAAGENPRPYRLVVLLLHLLNMILVFELVRRLFGSARTGLLAALLFALQTSYDEALFWIAAFFHPLNAFFCLGTLVAYLGFLETRNRRALAAAVLLFACGLLTKAPTFALLAVLPFLPTGNRRHPPASAALVPFLTLWTAAVAVNLATGVGDSYLLGRGFYRIGLHMATNLLDYLAWMLLPFHALADRLGVVEPIRGLAGALGLAGAVVLFWLLVRAGAATRFVVVLTLATLAPFLPFTFEPVSRYTYLPAAGLAAVLALGVAAALRHSVGSRKPAAFCALALIAIFALSYADRRLKDNHYEYRERRMTGWVEDVLAAVPRVPPDSTITIIGLPTLAIDPGIHFEAALKLAYNEPSVRLDLREVGEAAPPDALFYDQERIRRWR